MELYHIHLLGNHDRLYKENKEFVVDKNKFNNRIYNRVYNMTPNVDVNRYREIMNVLNYYRNLSGFRTFDNNINLGEIIEFIQDNGVSPQDIRNILEDAKKIALAEGINLREMAMEEYRKENCSNLPSRMHSLFACTEEGINFWANQITDNGIELYRIDVFDEPFVSNERLLPSEELNYGDKIKASYKYFHPNKKDLSPMSDEYLVQGKVRILEKLDEVRR